MVHLELELLDRLGDLADLTVPRDGVEAEEVRDVGLDVEVDLGEGQALAVAALALLVAREQGLGGGEEVGAVDRGELAELGHEVLLLALGRDDHDRGFVARDQPRAVDELEVGGDVVVAVEGGDGGLPARDLPLGDDLHHARHAVLVGAERLELDVEALAREEGVDLVGVAREDALERQRVGEAAERGEALDEPALLGRVLGLAAGVPVGHEVEVVLAELDAARERAEARGAARDGSAPIGDVARAERSQGESGVLGGDVSELQGRGGVDEGAGGLGGHGGLGGEVGDGIGVAHCRSPSVRVRGVCCPKRTAECNIF